MKRRQLTLLLLCNFERFVIGNMLMIFLPLYANRLGANPSMTGFYLALSFFTLTLGTLLSGWLTNRFQNAKRVTLITSLCNLPMYVLLSQADRFELLVIFTMMAWFIAGITIGSISILVGAQAQPSARGKIFGLVGATEGLAQLVAGFISGRIVDNWGFSALFVVAMLIEVAYVITAVFLNNHVAEQKVSGYASKAGMKSRRGFLTLALASTLAYTILFSVNLGRPILMDSLGFDATAISSVFVIGGIVTLPLPFLMGWLSDRVGRRQLLMVCYALIGGGALVLASATTMQAFWFSTLLMTVIGASRSLGTALTADVVRPEILNVSLARYSATSWIGGVVGFGAAGIVIEALGIHLAILAAAVLTLPAIGLIWSLSDMKAPGRTTAIKQQTAEVNAVSPTS